MIWSKFQILTSDRSLECYTVRTLIGLLTFANIPRPSLTAFTLVLSASGTTWTQVLRLPPMSFSKAGWASYSTGPRSSKGPPPSTNPLYLLFLLLSIPPSSFFFHAIHSSHPNVNFLLTNKKSSMRSEWTVILSQAKRVKYTPLRIMVVIMTGLSIGR